jgi:hypothetical protein
MIIWSVRLWEQARCLPCITVSAFGDRTLALPDLDAMTQWAPSAGLRDDKRMQRPSPCDQL